MDQSINFWILFHFVILLLIALDLYVFRKGKHSFALASAIVWSVVWIFISLIFNYFIYKTEGTHAAIDFFTCYLIEKSLSIDNLFVFCLIFSALGIAEKFHHKILYWGVLGALLLRISLILLGIAALEKFAWLYIVLGGFLTIAALRLGWSCLQENQSPSIPLYKWVVSSLPRPVHDAKGRFFIRKGGRVVITTSFVALVLIELADVVFALDSIPAVLGITTNRFIVYTSNILALLGLRSLYFVLVFFKKRSGQFTFALSCVLLFIGVKMLLGRWWHLSSATSLATIGAIFLIVYVIHAIKKKL